MQGRHGTIRAGRAQATNPETSMAEHEKVLRHGLQHPPGGHVRSASRDDDSREPEEGGLLTSPAFWIGGVLCLLTWVSVLAFLGFL
ncbi:hypothetical protein GCM10028796_33090 [Ramlibacter monticola]